MRTRTEVTDLELSTFYYRLRTLDNELLSEDCTLSTKTPNNRFWTENLRLKTI